MRAGIVDGNLCARAGDERWRLVVEDGWPIRGSPAPAQLTRNAHRESRRSPVTGRGPGTERRDPDAIGQPDTSTPVPWRTPRSLYNTGAAKPPHIGALLTQDSGQIAKTRAVPSTSRPASISYLLLGARFDPAIHGFSSPRCVGECRVPRCQVRCQESRGALTVRSPPWMTSRMSSDIDFANAADRGQRGHWEVRGAWPSLAATCSGCLKRNRSIFISR